MKTITTANLTATITANDDGTTTISVAPRIRPKKPVSFAESSMFHAVDQNADRIKFRAYRATHCLQFGEGPNFQAGVWKIEDNVKDTLDVLVFSCRSAAACLEAYHHDWTDTSRVQKLRDYADQIEEAVRTM